VLITSIFIARGSSIKIHLGFPKVIDLYTSFSFV